jgi:hypothetical protein
MPELTRREYIAAQLMGAILIENRIAWTKDPECFGILDLREAADNAVFAADILLKTLDNSQTVHTGMGGQSG